MRHGMFAALAIRPPFRPIAALLTCMATTGCGGSGDGGVGSIADDDLIGGIDAGGIRFATLGPINGFGSVIVNGVSYDTSQAEIIVDDAVATDAELRLGYIVRVTGTSDDGVASADRVIFDDNVEGPVTAVDETAGVVTVLGQTVRIIPVTLFDDAIATGSLAGLSSGDVIEVSGHFASDGATVATRIDLVANPGEYEATGFVSNLDAAGKQFRINALVVDYSSAMLEGFESGEISAGDFVEVRGIDAGGVAAIDATRVEREGTFNDSADVDDTDVELEGLVTRFVSPTDFDVAGVPVTTTVDTQFEDGAAADLDVDVLVEVRGRFDADGVLVADAIEFEEDGPIEISARVDGVDTGPGEVTVLGITIVVDAEAILEDESDMALRPFTIADINPGDWLEIKGDQRDTSVVRASLLERDDDANDEVSLQGFATDVEEPGFRILGVHIETDSGTEFDDTDPQTFFANAEGRLVEVDGSWDGATLHASEVEFDEDADPD